MEYFLKKLILLELSCVLGKIVKTKLRTKAIATSITTEAILFVLLGKKIGKIFY
jgi:hypothetical protein